MFTNVTGVTWLEFAGAAGKTLVAVGKTEFVVELTAALPPDEAPPPVERDTLDLIVVQGARMMSSWSMPNALAPFGASTPTTLNPTLWIRSSCPTGERFWNSSRTIVWPTRHTRAALRTSESPNVSPS